MSKRLTPAIALVLGALSLGMMAAPASADWDDEGEGDDALDFAVEMATGGYAEIRDGYENGEYVMPYTYGDDDEDDYSYGYNGDDEDEDDDE